jgi:HSP20 family protein
LALVTRWLPRTMDARCDDARFCIEADLPGFRIEDLDITLERRVLTIAGERSIDRDGGSRWILGERPSGAFRRAFRLPFDAEPGEIEARLADGVLTLTAPRSAASRPRKVEVTAG